MLNIHSMLELLRISIIIYIYMFVFDAHFKILIFCLKGCKCCLFDPSTFYFLIISSVYIFILFFVCLLQKTSKHFVNHVICFFHVFIVLVMFLF